MTEYVDYPAGVHIDASYAGVDSYDPYPDRRQGTPGRPNGNPGWMRAGSARPPEASTPRIAPTNQDVASPIPTVHRMTPNFDDEFARPPTALSSPNFAYARAAEQAANMPWLTRSPTNVSYPTLARQTWVTNHSQHQPRWRTTDTASSFQPIQASTPVPSRYGDPIEYPDAPPTYYPRQHGAIAENVIDPHSPPAAQRFEFDAPHHPEEFHSERPPPRIVDEVELENEMMSNSGSISEPEFDEEFVPLDVPVESHQEDMPGTMPTPQQEPPINASKSKKRFVGGFWAGLRNFTGFGPKPSLTPLAIPNSTQPAPHMPEIPAAPPSETENSIRPLSVAHRPSLNSTHLLIDPSFATDPTPAESHGLATTDQSELPITIPDLPEDSHLPNPHEETAELITAPVHPQTPQEVDLQMTADYDAMSEPIEDERPETTFSSHINRVGKFLSDLVHLPWISPTNISEPYNPTVSRRAWPKDSKPATSWYTKGTHEKLDLLATPTTHSVQRRHAVDSMRVQTRQVDRQRHHAHSQHPHQQQERSARRTRRPLSGTTDGTSSTRSRHQRRIHAPTHDPRLTLTPSQPPTTLPIPVQLPMPSSNMANLNAQAASPYNYYYSPQPFLIYPSPVASPHSGSGQGQPTYSQGLNANVNDMNGNGLSGNNGGQQQASTLSIRIPIPMSMPGQAGVPGVVGGGGGVGGGGAPTGIPTMCMITPTPIVLPQPPYAYPSSLSPPPSRQHTVHRRSGKGGRGSKEDGGGGGGGRSRRRNSQARSESSSVTTPRGKGGGSATGKKGQNLGGSAGTNASGSGKMSPRDRAMSRSPVYAGSAGSNQPP